MGFGGDKNNAYKLQAELSTGLFLNRHWVVGAEYRQKPDNLSAAQEDDWYDAFVGWFPNKRVAIVAAWSQPGQHRQASRSTQPVSIATDKPLTGDFDHGINASVISVDSTKRNSYSGLPAPVTLIQIRLYTRQWCTSRYKAIVRESD